MRRFSVAVALCSLALVSKSASAATALPLGAAFADRPLADGSVAVWGGLGFPSVAVGYRQGFPGFEGGATVGFDYARTELDLEAPFRFAIKETPQFKVALAASVGGFFDFGASYYEPTNLPSAGLRLGAGADLSVKVAEALAVTGNFWSPADICLTERGNHRWDFLFGGGAELGLGDGFTFGAQALVGPELLHPRGGQSTARLGLSVLAVLGKRIF